MANAKPLNIFTDMKSNKIQKLTKRYLSCFVAFVLFRVCSVTYL